MSLKAKEAGRFREARNFVDALKTLYPAAHETLDDIEAAVKSWTPEEPLFREGSDKTYCPGCKHPISRYAKGHGNYEVSFCKWCGQKIDWSVLDKNMDEEECDTYDENDSYESDTKEPDKSEDDMVLKDLMAAFCPNSTNKVNTVVVRRFRRTN